MDFSPLPVTSVIGAFLLAFPALFSIVNPIGASLIFNEVTGDLSREDRARLATRISVYSLLVLLVSLWLGSYILNFFGISLGALRVAGGLVVAIRAWGLLMAPEVQEGRKADDAALAKGSHDDVAFFPLTMPFTTGPGTISVAIALSSQRPTDGPGTASFFIGASVAAVCMAAVIWLSYRSADRLLKLIGANGARVVSRLVALLLLCIGVQIISTGLESLLGPLIRGEVS
ncbi:MarC family protein [Caulobacter sp. NIBR2454]|uniref:MarC family protein n=1 Tax=Caulobacter sp. NIBR2454 TaxID=3015996 RepID=UPI0022B6F232|nr:MarC family protein [Caulobacter sp. NIBR2454]